ncbi:MAG TPA: prepilin-type N-terminal cleavage/methylation domain-containing protein [Bacteroidia bacterium]|jgi:prepilin-type N-terminal cleavage/methylation domain-containing protein|nr:prepilin-type N-terminal cleavage/methylation domain-containing protein [Bacteroidia bacterium]
MKKLAAFTLIELLIGMLISSIVITFGYLAYRFTNEQYLGYKQIKEQLVEVSQFNTVFSEDLRRAEIVSSTANTIEMYYKQIPALDYEFAADYVVRKANALTDTFNIAAVRIEQQFVFPEERVFLQHLSFEATILKETEQFNFTKAYSSETIMNYKVSKAIPLHAIN